jgi:drug/metabolite transporter (DMT)-like permease
MVLLAGVLWAFNGVVSKLLLQGGFDALQLTTFRAAGAVPALLLLVLLRRPRPRMTLTRAEAPRLFIYGLAGMFFVPVLYFVSISRLPVGIGLLFEYTGPAFVAVWVWLGERQRVKARLWLGIALCLVGLALVAEVHQGQLRLDGLGVAAGLGCAVLLAFYYVVGSRSVNRRDALSVTTYAFIVAALAGAVIRPWWNFPGHVLGGSSQGAPMWLLAAYLIVFGTVVPYLLAAASMRHLPPTSVGIIGMIEPVLASAFAWYLLDEHLLGVQLVGGLVVLAGVVLAETARTVGPGESPELPPG